MKYFSTMIVALTMVLTGCASMQGSAQDVSGQFTASPQKVAQVQELEQQGVIRDVVIMESEPAQITAQGAENVMACLSSEGGNWLQEYNECEYLPRQQCESLGGQFKECASVCRHNPDARVCIMMCVQVCNFEQ